MTRLMFLIVRVSVWTVAAAGLFAQVVEGPAQKADLVAVAGCLAQEGASWTLTNATGPLLAPTPDGKGQTSTSVTVDMARHQNLGNERYRLIGVLSEFNVAEHKGHKVLVKGLAIRDSKERRINLVSLLMVDPTCGVTK